MEGRAAPGQPRQSPEHGVAIHFKLPVGNGVAGQSIGSRFRALREPCPQRDPLFREATGVRQKVIECLPTNF